MQKKTRKILTFTSLLMVFALAMAACQPASTPTPTPPPEDLEEEAPTEADPETSAPLVPSITNPRNDPEGAIVVVDKVVMDQQGWLVIHAEDGGQPGPVIGYVEVPEGVSTEVYIEIIPDEITQTLYAMLHLDADPLSEFDFPEGNDAPVTVDGEVVVTPFNAITEIDMDDEEQVEGDGEESSMAEDALQVPRIVNPRQRLADGTIVIDKVYMDQSGWVVIHADQGGQPGPVIGYKQVPEGISTEVYIQISNEDATPALYAMLHVDSEPLGEFNFPDGDDVPVTVDGEVVTKAFESLTEVDLGSENDG